VGWGDENRNRLEGSKVNFFLMLDALSFFVLHFDSLQRRIVSTGCCWDGDW
jgi:hypothetical protein